LVGGANVIPVDFGSRSLITKIAFVANVGFTLALFNRLEAAAGTLTGPMGPEQLYRVAPDFVSVANVVQYFAEMGEQGPFMFFNQDKGISGNRLGNARKLYLRVTAAGVGVGHALIGGLIHQ